MPKARIMVVEDEAIVSLDAQLRLERLGYQVAATAMNGAEALEKAAASRPDLVLMDIMLQGGGDGIATAAQMRSRLSLPVVFLTAFADEQTLERAKTCQPYGYLIKPFQDRELVVAIDMALSKHAMERRVVEKERLLSTTLESIGDAVLTTDAAGAIQYLNPAARELLGKADATALGRRLADIIELRDDHGRNVTRQLTDSLEQGGADAARCLRLSLINGRRVPVSLTLSAVAGHAGGLGGAVFVLKDLTEQHQAESALESSIQKLKSVLNETVNALAATSEKRDPYTAGHQQRVAQLACAIAGELGFAEDRVECIRVAAILHDLGKIYVPAEILSKPTRLTMMEMGIVKTHSEVGFDILKNIPFPWPVAQAVFQHHERLDGSGYPGGLASDDILPEARILAVADVMEAMSSHRPYRAALGINAALEEITRNRGKLYDADVADTCLELFYKRDFRFSAS